MFILCLLYLKFAEISYCEGWGFNKKSLLCYFSADFEAARLKCQVYFVLVFVSVLVVFSSREREVWHLAFALLS